MIPADFDPATHVAFGPWCFFKAETLYPDWENLSFVEDFTSAAERCEAGEACRALANQLLDRLWPQMNERHGTAHGRDYWHVVLMNWLMHLVMLSWRLWRHTERFVEHFAQEEFDVNVATVSRRFSFASTFEFVLACFGKGEFRSYLIGEIVRRIAPTNWHLQDGRLIEPPLERPLPPVERVRRPVENIGGMGRWAGVLSTCFNLLPSRPRQARLRREPVRVEFPERFLALLDELVESTLPESLRAGFSHLEVDASRKDYRRGRVYATNIAIHDDQNSIVLGHAVEAGERVVAVQHGGSYGWAALLPLLAELEYWHEGFVTWGWREHDEYDGRFIPLPYPMLSRNLDAHRPVDERMLFVGAVMYSMNPRIDLYPGMLQYRRNKREFLSALPHNIRAKAQYRPYYSELSFEDATYLRRTFPDLEIHAGDLLASLLRTKLAVLDHHTTTLSISMAANVPTICFWDDNAWPIASTARRHFAKLKEVGIVFDTPREAARQVDYVWPHVQEWWFSREIQTARRGWCREFARTSRIWPLYWMKGLAAA